MTIPQLWAFSILLSVSAASPAAAGIAESNPFAIVDKALQLRQDKTDAEFREILFETIAASNRWDADSLLLLLAAEMMQQIGDYGAEDLFEKAISRADDEAAYELFYADYLRNFRGPRRPLFQEAEEHYFAALAKLSRQRSPPPWSQDVRERVWRGLVALYQEDGIPLAWQQGPGPRKPFLFFSSRYRQARSTADLGEIHDARDWTAEALFAESAMRLHRALSDEELSGLVREKEPTELYERLRFRVEGVALDLFYAGRDVQNAQVTDFRRPNDFNRVRVRDLGGEVSATFDEAPSFDGYIRQAGRLIDRRGLIETRPESWERVYQSETEIGISHLSGPHETDYTLSFVAQDINPQIANPPRRHRRIAAFRVDHQLLRPLGGLGNPFRHRFTARGLRVFSGIADDWERFGDFGVRRDDLFVGASLQGLGPFDLTLQPAVFREQVSGDKSQTSSQLRLDGALVVRLLDEERNPGIPGSFLGLRPAFVHLVAAAKRDRSLEGLPAFENDRIGAGLETKFFIMPFDEAAPASPGRFAATTLLVGCHYARERFPRLDRRVNLMELYLSLGF